MSKRDALYQSLFASEGLVLPDDEAERKQALRSLFGAKMVACVDVGIEETTRVLEGNAEFADFTPEQKARVLALVSHNAYGTLYWQCVKLDNFPGADVEITLTERADENKEPWSTRIAGLTENELHHEFLDWADRFGDHYDYYSGIRFAPATHTMPPG